MKIIKISALLSALIAISVPAQASCYEQATSTKAMLICQHQDLAQLREDKANIIKQLQATINESQQQSLAQAEQAWQNYAEKECAFAASYAAGGTLAGVNRLDCLIDMFKQRNARLRKHLQKPN